MHESKLVNYKVLIGAAYIIYIVDRCLYQSDLDLDGIYFGPYKTKKEAELRGAIFKQNHSSDCKCGNTKLERQKVYFEQLPDGRIILNKRYITAKFHLITPEGKCDTEGERLLDWRFFL